MNYFVIGDQDTVLGFNLAGVEGKVVKNKEEVLEAFSVAVSDEKIGIVVITEKAANQIRDRINDYLFTKDFPLIVEIPDREGVDPNRVGFRQLVNKAIGIKL